jgi:hypothetical protein
VPRPGQPEYTVCVDCGSKTSSRERRCLDCYSAAEANPGSTEVLSYDESPEDLAKRIAHGEHIAAHAPTARVDIDADGGILATLQMVAYLARAPSGRFEFDPDNARYCRFVGCDVLLSRGSRKSGYCSRHRSARRS